MYRLGVLSTQLKTTDFNNMDDCQIVSVKQEDFYTQMLPLDGLILHEEEGMKMEEICRVLLTLKQVTTAYIWILTDQPSLIHQKVYLQLGVDGVLDSRCFPEVLLLHAKNAFRRQQKAESDEASLLQRRELSINGRLNEANLSISFVGSLGEVREISLTKLEYRLLELLFSNPGTTFNYEEIGKYLWGENYKEVMQMNYRITNIVFHIRSKLIKYGIDKMYIKTVRSIGYLVQMREYEAFNECS